MPPLPLRDRYRGALLGLAAGDAVGTTLEFTNPGAFAPLTDLVGGGPFHLQPGQWTDDTSMAICLAESLAALPAFDARDQMTRYLRWYRTGYRSSTGACFDIGVTVREALVRFEAGGEPFAGAADPAKAGNGSLMRLAPVALRYAQTPALALHYAAESSRTTHAAPQALDACRYFAGLLIGALGGAPKAELLAPFYTPVPEAWTAAPLHPAVAVVAAGSFHHKQPPAIRGTGYVVDALEAALWAFAATGDFRAGCLAAANLGEDADTTAAIYGQLAGAFYGVEAIPAAWRAQLAEHALLESLADQLLARADTPAPSAPSARPAPNLPSSGAAGQTRP